MNTTINIKTALVSSITALAFLLPSAVEAAPAFRVRVGGYNPETGNAGRVVGGYNNETGARSFRARGYDASTQTYRGATRAFDPSTGEGFSTTTQATRGVGATTTVNTLNNGSYTCSVSPDMPYQCVENGSGL